MCWGFWRRSDGLGLVQPVRRWGVAPLCLPSRRARGRSGVGSGRFMLAKSVEPRFGAHGQSNRRRDGARRRCACGLRPLSGAGHSSLGGQSCPPLRFTPRSFGPVGAAEARRVHVISSVKARNKWRRRQFGRWTGAVSPGSEPFRGLRLVRAHPFPEASDLNLASLVRGLSLRLNAKSDVRCS